MKSKSITIGIFLSVALVMTAAGLYWMASSARAGNHHLAISTVRQIQQLEAQWSIETARVRSDPLSDFDSLTIFIPRIERLKATLSEAIRGTPNLPDRLVNDTNAYLSAIDAKEERIERFKMGYAVLRNSVRYLPLAATNVMQQMQTRGGNSAFIKNIATVTDEINTYLASPAPPEKERLMRVLGELGDGIASRHPTLVNTAMNFVAHGQVLLDKQAPTEEIFQEATSNRISDLGGSLIRGFESEIDKKETLAAWYERGIVGMGAALWLMWLGIAFRLPKKKEQARNGSVYRGHATTGGDAASPLPKNPLILRQQAGPGQQAGPRQQAGPGQDEGLERLTADLIKTKGFYTEETSPTSAAEFTAYQIGVELASEQLVALAGRINSSTDVLNDMPVKQDDSGPEYDPSTPDADAGYTPDVEPSTPDAEREATDVDREATAAVMSSIHTQANEIVKLAKRLPALSPKRDDVYAQLDLNDYIDEIADSTQARIRSLVVKELNPIPTVRAAESDIYLMFTNIIENAVLAIQERRQKKGIIRVETKQDNGGIRVTITDNGIGIRPERRKKVFNPFYTTRDGAIGMGLTVTRYLVEKYDGTILMNSVPNQGTVIRIMLPTQAQAA